jgi:hypothetical protein
MKLSKDKLFALIDRYIDSFKNSLEVTPKKLEFADMDYKFKKFQEFTELNLKLKLVLDDSKLDLDLIFRFYDNSEIMETAMKFEDSFVKRLEETPFITLVPRQFEFIDEMCLVYSVPKGDDINTVDDLFRDFLIGKVMACIHGKELNNFRIDGLRQTLYLLLDNMPFSKSAAATIKNLIDKYEIGNYTLTGYTPYTEVKPNNWVISSTKPLDDMYEIGKGKDYQVYVPVRPEDISLKDRFFDICNLYAEEIFLEYIEKQSINNIQEKIEALMAGYSNHLYQSEGVRLNNLNPEGNTMDLQVILTLWLIKSLEIDVDNLDRELIYNIEDFSIYILGNKLFSEIHNIEF